MLGLLTGFVGVLTVLAVWSGVDSGTVAGSAACLTAAVCYGMGFAYTRRYFSGGGHSAVALAAAQVTCAAVESAVLVALFAGPPQWPGPGAALALVVLGGVGTGVAFVMNLRVIQTVGPATASTVTYLIPLWSTVLGAVFLAEPLGWHVLLGGLLIIIGAVLVQRPRAAATPPGAPHGSPHGAIADGGVRVAPPPSRTMSKPS